MSKYKIEIRNSPNWQDYSAATLGVSIESPNWRGEKLASILEFASKRFDLIRIDVTDALYHHKIMAAGVDEEKAYAGADALGSLWLAQHQELIDTCPVEVKIIRWSEWYLHNDYQKTISVFKHAYNENVVFREAIERDVDEFFRRQGGAEGNKDRECSIDFLIEEVAVISLQAKELSSVRIYPGEQLECLQVVRSGAVCNVPDWLQNEQFAKIKFKKRKALIPVSGEGVGTMLTA